MSNNEARDLLHNWLITVTDDADSMLVDVFEHDLARLLRDDDLSVEEQQHIAEVLEYKVLTRKIHPSQRQRARFWMVRARQYLQQGQFMQGFEALSLCEEHIPHHETAMRLYVHSLLINLSLQQGHYLQSLINSVSVTSFIQTLVPQFQALQQHQPDRMLGAADEVAHLMSGATEELGIGDWYVIPS